MKRDDDLPPLGTFAASLLEAEKRRRGPTARQRRSVWQRARATLAASGLLASTVWGGKATVAAGLSKTLSKLGAVALWGAVATGAVAVATVSWPRGHRAESARGPGPQPAAVAVRAEARPAPAARPHPPADAAAPQVPAAHSDAEKSRFSRERQLIDQARAALSAGDLTAARGALERHARRFPGACSRRSARRWPC
jgi:hypothetical protein